MKNARFATLALLVGALVAPATAVAAEAPTPSTAATPATTSVTTPGPSGTTVPTTAPDATTPDATPVPTIPPPDAVPTPTIPTLDTIPDPTIPPPDTTPPRIGVTVTHPHFSPNRDGVRDRTRLDLSADEPLEVDVVFRNASGSAQNASHLSFGPGEASVKWGGHLERNGDRFLAPDGDYIVDIVGTDGDGNVTRKSRGITVDTKGPSFVWTGITPDPWGATGPVTYRFTSNDRSGPLTTQGTAWNRAGLLDASARLSRPTGTVTFSWRPNYPDGSVFLPGNYLAAMNVSDQAGNRTVSPFRGFRVDRPVATTVVRQVPGAGNRVALTFDDCNSGGAWTSILYTLGTYNAGGTFFCPADQVYAHPSQARAAAFAGMTIASHTSGHQYLSRLSYSDVVSRMRSDQSAWWSVARVTPAPYFRPPYGDYDSTVLAAAGATGYRYTVLWDVDPSDYRNPGPSVITSRVLAGARSGSIIILHVQDQTAAALPAIIGGLRARGLQPVTLADLFAAAGWH